MKSVLLVHNATSQEPASVLVIPLINAKCREASRNAIVVRAMYVDAYPGEVLSKKKSAASSMEQRRNESCP